MPRISAVNRRYSFTRPSFKPLNAEEQFLEYLRSIRSPLNYLTKINVCEMCAMALIQIAKLCCCQPCFMNWLYLEDNTKCSTCGILLKNILTREQADKFCERINLKWKRLTSSGHVVANYLIERRIQRMVQKTSN